MRTNSKFRLWVCLTIAFVVLQALDVVFTSIGVYVYGPEMEANPISAYLFDNCGFWQGVVILKVFFSLIFFGLLLYSIYVRWTLLDLIGLLWKRPPKRDEAYAMACFNLVGIVTLLVSLYAGAGWMYVLTSLRSAN